MTWTGLGALSSNCCHSTLTDVRAGWKALDSCNFTFLSHIDLVLESKNSSQPAPTRAIERRKCLLAAELLKGSKPIRDTSLSFAHHKHTWLQTWTALSGKFLVLLHQGWDLLLSYGHRKPERWSVGVELWYQSQPQGHPHQTATAGSVVASICQCSPW